LKGSGNPLSRGTVFSHEGKEILEVTSVGEGKDEFFALGYRHRSAETITEIDQNGSFVQVINA
jgi:hypothetical protein